MAFSSTGRFGHGLLSGHLRPDTQFAVGDWRSSSEAFRGDAYRRNLAKVTDLERLAREDLGITLSQLAVAWTLSNPAVHVAIVGTRNPAHVDEGVAAASISLDDAVIGRIDEIMRDAAPVAGPSPEGMPES